MENNPEGHLQHGVDKKVEWSTGSHQYEFIKMK